MYLRFSTAAAGTTEHAIFGVNHSGALTNRALGTNAYTGGDGVWATVETDGSASSSGRSYAIFTSAGPTVAPAFSSASARTFDPFFTSPPFAGIPGGAPSGQWSDVPNSRDPQWMQNAVIREWQAMAAAIAHDTDVPVTGDYGRHILACIDAAMMSAREGRNVNVSA